jgi:hypothetical protein
LSNSNIQRKEINIQEKETENRGLKEKRRAQGSEKKEKKLVKIG